MEIYRFIAPALAAYYIYRLTIELRVRRKFLFTNIVWLGFWSVIAVLGIAPDEFSKTLAGLLGFASNINAIIFIALAFLVVLVFYMSSKLDTLERKLTELVRQIALDESKIRELERKRISDHQKDKNVLEEV
ncbi:MAG: hypothetical protein ACI9FN_000102 [Saprospiraceae bacterium]